MNWVALVKALGAAALFFTLYGIFIYFAATGRGYVFGISVSLILVVWFFYATFDK